MNYTDIEKTLQARLEAAISAVNSSLTLLTENKRYEPKAGVSYIRAAQSPAATTRLTTHADVLSGVYLIDVIYPFGNGSTAARSAADAIGSYFPRTLQLTSADDDTIKVRVARTYTSIATTTATHYIVPITVQWICEQTLS